MVRKSVLRPMLLLGFASMTLLACRNGSVTSDRAGVVEAGTTPGPASSASASTTVNAPARDGGQGCEVLPRGGVAIPSSARAVDVRLATSGGRALVTWFETTKTEGPDRLAAYGHAFDGSALGPRITFETADVGDELHSGAAPVVRGGELAGLSCYYAAPAGGYRCTSRTVVGTKTTLFDFRGIAAGGPQSAGIAAVTKGDDALLFVPAAPAEGVHLFSAKVSEKKKAYPFPLPGAAPVRVDGLGAALAKDDEVVVVYRAGDQILARRAAFDQTWRSKPFPLSAKGALVGAPVIASDGERNVALFSQRAKTSDPWRVFRAEWIGDGTPSASELPTGSAEAQGPAIATASERGCFLVGWVDGSGKTTRTMLGRACQGGAIASESRLALSAAGVEGGRPALATDPASPSSAFVVWQELPSGKPVELRIAKLSCPGPG